MEMLKHIRIICKPSTHFQLYYSRTDHLNKDFCLSDRADHVYIILSPQISGT
jgi:hypothetical protein